MERLRKGGTGYKRTGSLSDTIAAGLLFHTDSSRPRRAPFPGQQDLARTNFGDGIVIHAGDGNAGSCQNGDGTFRS